MTSPPELFYDWLTHRPGDARVAVAIDSDRFLADARVLDKPSVCDTAGREWQLAVYRGDDLAFRIRFRRTVSAGRTVIVLTRGALTPSPTDAASAVDKPIDISLVSDLVARNEAGPPLDLSVRAFFRHITPKINCPVVELRRFKQDLLARLDFVSAAAEKLIERWGKPDSWGRGQVAAMVLLAHHPELHLSDIWPDETEPTAFLAHVIRLLVATPQLQPQRDITRQIIAETARQQVQGLLFWADAEPEELAAYLVLRDLAQQNGLQNPATQLAGLQIFSPDLAMSRMEPLALKVLDALKSQSAVWARIGLAAETFLTPRRAAKVTELLPPAFGQKDVGRLLQQEIPAILRQQLHAILLGFLGQPSLASIAWLAPLDRHPVLSVSETLTDTSCQCRAGIRCLLSLLRLEQRLATAAPNFPHADALLDWYVQQAHHLLELDLANAGHYLAEFDDDNITQLGQHYLFGSDELNPPPSSLKGRVVARLEELNRALAAFVRSGAVSFQQGVRSVRGLLRDKIDVKQIVTDTLPGRVWVLIFDGMRLDTWEAVVRPLLASFFNITDRPCFSLLPSYTEIARTGLLGGGLPGEWKGFKGNFTQDEAQLFAVNMGLTPPESKTKLRFVTDADTTKARKKMGFTDKDAALLNVLIYPISDAEAHTFEGDLTTINNTIRAKMLGDKTEGVRGIRDDLLKRIGPDDVVVLSSDHGFIELLHGYEVAVKEAEAKKAGQSLEDGVRWRYVHGFAPAAMPDAVEVPVPEGKVWLAVGQRWFRRDGTKAVPRYSHGGLSLAETVVPGVVLRRITEKTARAELQGLPTVVQGSEDSSIPVDFSIRNTGNVAIEWEIRASTNLGDELLKLAGHLNPAETESVTAPVTARYRMTAAREPDPTGTVTAITLRLRHTGLTGVWQDALDGMVTIPVKVHPNAVKFDTEALKGFDEV